MGAGGKKSAGGLGLWLLHLCSAMPTALPCKEQHLAATPLPSRSLFLGDCNQAMPLSADFFIKLLLGDLKELKKAPIYIE